MKRTIMISTLAATLMASTTVMGNPLSCTVNKIDGNMVVLDCGDKAASLKADQKVELKMVKEMVPEKKDTVKKDSKPKNAIEGC